MAAEEGAVSLLRYPFLEVWLAASILLVGYAALRALLARSAAREDERSKEAEAFWARRPPQWIPGRSGEMTPQQIAYDECQRAKLEEWRLEGRQKGYLT